MFDELDATSRLEDQNEARRQDDQSFFEEIVADIKDVLKTQKRYAHCDQLRRPNFVLTFSRLPGTISNVYENLKKLLDKMTKGSILPVTTFSLHVL